MRLWQHEITINEYVYICKETVAERGTLFSALWIAVMEVKKTPEADLESKRTTWLLMGYVVVLSLLYVAFEWNTVAQKTTDISVADDSPFEEEIMMPVTVIPPEPPLPPQPVEPPEVAEQLKIVDDKAVIEKTVDLFTEEDLRKVLVAIQNTAPVPMRLAEDAPAEEEIFEVVERMPSYPGGYRAFMRYLQNNIVYPSEALQKRVQGCVKIQFVVNEDGSIVDAEVAEGVNPYLDKEALRVINAMPKWEPGMQHNQPVRVKIAVPVMFRLR